MSKNNDNAKSIDLGDESDDQEEFEDLNDVELRDRREAQRSEEEPKEKSYWNRSKKTRDHATQMVMRLGANLGNCIDGEFKKGVFALKNIDGIRTYISHKDDGETRELMILVSKLNLMRDFIVPLFECSEDDTEVLTPLMRLFLALTRGLRQKKRDSVVTRVRERPLNKELKADCLKRVKEEKLFQNNAYEQISALMKFKEAIVTDKVFHVIYEHIDGAVSRSPKARSETFLFLLTNLLQIQAGPFSPSTEQIHSRSLQNKLILILARKDFFDLLLLLCTTINAQGNNQWNSLIVEILHFLLW